MKWGIDELYEVSLINGMLTFTTAQHYQYIIQDVTTNTSLTAR